MGIEWDRYSAAVFIDSNVALECLALEQLPWREIQSDGLILVLVVPVVLREVDSKKHHPRLGDHARRFNNTLRPLLEEQSTVVIRQSPAPTVELALAVCGRINWAQFQDLDPDEPDSKLVAEALLASGPPHERRVVLSQDIRPLNLARSHGLRIHHIGKNWLRPKEISEADKKLASLQRQVEAMKSRQPRLDISIRTNKSSVLVHQVQKLSARTRAAIRSRIIELNPMPRQAKPSSRSLDLGTYDPTLAGRYKEWRTTVIPQFMKQYERKVEINFGQIEIVVRVENSGNVPAEALLLHVSVQGGWLNTKHVLVSPSGPAAPPQLSSLFGPGAVHQSNHVYRTPGKHEFAVQQEPERSAEVRIACADFRHGYHYEYRVIGWADPHAEEFRVDVVGTAANLYGSVEQTHVVERTVTQSSVNDLVDLNTLRFRQPVEIVELLKADDVDFPSVEHDGADWDI